MLISFDRETGFAARGAGAFLAAAAVAETGAAEEDAADLRAGRDAAALDGAANDDAPLSSSSSSSLTSSSSPDSSSEELDRRRRRAADVAGFAVPRCCWFCCLPLPRGFRPLADFADFPLFGCCSCSLGCFSSRSKPTAASPADAMSLAPAPSVWPAAAQSDLPEERGQNNVIRAESEWMNNECLLQPHARQVRTVFGERSSKRNSCAFAVRLGRERRQLGKRLLDQRVQVIGGHRALQDIVLDSARTTHRRTLSTN